MIGIYKIECTINNKCYIGQSKDINTRLIRHKSNLNKNKADNPYFQAAWNKYGEKAFTFSILEECLEDSLDEREIYWINKLKSMYNQRGYNIAPGGTKPPSPKNRILSEESKQKHRGENSKVSKLTEKQIIEIHSLYTSGICQRDLARRFNIATSIINKIINFKQWNYMKNNNEIIKLYKNIDTKKLKEEHMINQNYKNSKLKEEQIMEIHKLFNQGKTKLEIAFQFNTHYTTIGRILLFKRWAHIKPLIEEMYLNATNNNQTDCF